MTENDSPAEPNRFPQRFVFHGNAVSAETYLTRVGDAQTYLVHPVTGQSSLPVIGGHSESAPPNPEWKVPELGAVFDYTDAKTRADGRLDEKGVAVTLVQASVKNVRVTNQPTKDEPGPGPSEFRAASLSMSIRSVHPQKGQPSIEFVDEPQFQELTLDGKRIDLELNKELMALSRWNDLKRRFQKDKDFFEQCLECFGLPDLGQPPSFGDPIPRPVGGYALCSFVRAIHWGDETIKGHVLERKGFGAIYFGEMLINDRERRVTMVRMRLGSANGGQAVFVETAPNGTWWPPRK